MKFNLDKIKQLKLCLAAESVTNGLSCVSALGLGYSCAGMSCKDCRDKHDHAHAVAIRKYKGYICDDCVKTRETINYESDIEDCEVCKTYIDKWLKEDFKNIFNKLKEERDV